MEVLREHGKANVSAFDASLCVLMMHAAFVRGMLRLRSAAGASPALGLNVERIKLTVPEISFIKEDGAVRERQPEANQELIEKIKEGITTSPYLGNLSCNGR